MVLRRGVLPHGNRFRKRFLFAFFSCLFFWFERRLIFWFYAGLRSNKKKRNRKNKTGCLKSVGGVPYHSEIEFAAVRDPAPGGGSLITARGVLTTAESISRALVCFVFLFDLLFFFCLSFRPTQNIHKHDFLGGGSLTTAKSISQALCCSLFFWVDLLFFSV